ncbi:Hypothetical predicted protein, partial [Marmota monax]
VTLQQLEASCADQEKELVKEKRHLEHFGPYSCSYNNILSEISDQILVSQVMEDYAFVARLCEDQALCIKVQLLEKGKAEGLFRHKMEWNQAALRMLFRRILTLQDSTERDFEVINTLLLMSLYCPPTPVTPENLPSGQRLTREQEERWLGPLKA